MVVVMVKPHPMWLIMFTQVLGDHMPNFGLIGFFISFQQPNQLLVGVAIKKKQPITWSPNVKFQHDWYISYFLAAKVTFYGCGLDQTTPTHA